jgi:hypothetical protein
LWVNSGSLFTKIQKSPSAAGLKGIRTALADILPACKSISTYIIGLEIGVGHGLVMLPLTIVAADATAANAVNIATTANSFAKLCAFMNIPPT